VRANPGRDLHRYLRLKLGPSASVLGSQAGTSASVAGSQAGKKSESQAYSASKPLVGSPQISEASQKLAVEEWLEKSQQSRLQRVHDVFDAAGQDRYRRGVNEGRRQARINHHVAEMAYHVEKLALGYNAGVTCHGEGQIALSNSSDDGSEAQVKESQCIITPTVLMKAIWCKSRSKVSCHGEVARIFGFYNNT